MLIRKKRLTAGSARRLLPEVNGLHYRELTVSLVHMDKEKEPVDIFLRLPQEQRSRSVRASSRDTSLPIGKMISLAELVKTRKGIEEKTIYHKNLKKVTYVTGDVAGPKRAPFMQSRK